MSLRLGTYCHVPMVSDPACLWSHAAFSISVWQEEGMVANTLGNASVCLHFLYPDADNIDWSINVNVSVVVCCFSCLLIKIMQNEGKVIFRRKMKYNQQWLNTVCLEFSSAFCYTPRRGGAHNNWEELKRFILTCCIHNVWISPFQTMFWEKICVNLFVWFKKEKKMQPNVFCLYLLTHFSQLQMAFWTFHDFFFLFFFCLEKKIKGNSL